MIRHRHHRAGFRNSLEIHIRDVVIDFHRLENAVGKVHLARRLIRRAEVNVVDLVDRQHLFDRPPNHGKHLFPERILKRLR